MEGGRGGGERGEGGWAQQTGRRQREGEERLRKEGVQSLSSRLFVEAEGGRSRWRELLVGWLLNVPATC